MQGAATGSLTDRMIGAARLDVRTYEEVEHDESATQQALIVVVLAAIANGIGSLGEGGAGLIGGIIWGIIGWVVFAGIAYWVGTRLFASPTTSATWGQVLRTVGFARTPQLLMVIAFIPIIGWIIAFVVWVWSIVASVIALRTALDFSTGRAIGTGIIAAIANGIVLGIIALIFGIGR